MDTTPLEATAKVAMLSWGIEERETDIINEKVMQVFFDYFCSAFINFTHDKKRNVLVLNVLVTDPNFVSGFYNCINFRHEGSSQEQFQMAARAKLFYHTFTMGVSRKGGIGTITLKKYYRVPDDLLVNCCREVDPSKYGGVKQAHPAHVPVVSSPIPRPAEDVVPKSEPDEKSATTGRAKFPEISARLAERRKTMEERLAALRAEIKEAIEAEKAKVKEEDGEF